MIDGSDGFIARSIGAGLLEPLSLPKSLTELVGYLFLSQPHPMGSHTAMLYDVAWLRPSLKVLPTLPDLFAMVPGELLVGEVRTILNVTGAGIFIVLIQ